MMLHENHKKEVEVCISLSSFGTYDIKGDHHPGSRVHSFSDLTPESAGKVLQALIKLCEPDTAVPVLLSSKELKHACKSVQENDSYWMEKLVGLPDWEIEKLLNPQPAVSI